MQPPPSARVEHGMTRPVDGHGTDRLQALLEQLCQGLPCIMHEVEELRWENLRLKCELATHKRDEQVERIDRSESTIAIGSADSKRAKMAESVKPDSSDYSGTAVVRSGDYSVADASKSTQQIRQQSPPASKKSIGSPLSRRGSLSLGRFMMRSPWSEHQDLLKAPLYFTNSDHQRFFANSSTTQQVLVDPGICKLPVLHPDSVYKAFWVMGCVILLLYDVVTVPVSICFQSEDTAVTKTIDMISLLYWTLDIPVTFLTGVPTTKHVEMRVRYIAMMYIRRWFFFDLLIVVPEYIALLFTEFPGSHLTILRLLRWGRLMRLLRLTRLLRLARLQAALRKLALYFHLSKVYVELTRGLLGLTLMLFGGIHIISCAWYGFGSNFEEGWIRANGLQSAGTARLYIVSMHWTCNRLYGMMSSYRLETDPETFLDSFLTLLSLAVVAYYFGNVTAIVFVRSQSAPLNLWKASCAFTARHNISLVVSMRVEKALETSHYLCAGEIAKEETMLLDAIPASVKKDLIFESRVRYAVTNLFMKAMANDHERLLRDICNQAMTSEVIVEAEVVFADGDAGHSMRFVTSGTFEYERAMMTQQVQSRDSVSEAVLWTNWVHAGTLVALGESVVLNLNEKKLGKVVVDNVEASKYAVRYAKHFVWRLNLAPCDDLVHFKDLLPETLSEDLFEGAAEDHFVFISHYKVEAGTEATLIRDSLEPILKEDQGHRACHLQFPIFIDSEDLIDLGYLRKHVENTDTIMVLLTPGLLSRPWCLVEIVTAVRNDLNIVPVEVQRPGSKYQYPDEEFYAKILSGEFLNEDATDLLRSEGVTPEDVVNAIRRVFLKIALPFSPHKTKQVREAELHDILKRCNISIEERMSPMEKEEGDGDPGREQISLTKEEDRDGS